MMNYVSDWCPYIFGMSSFWYFDVFFLCSGLDKINMLESWYWKSELDGSFTSQWQSKKLMGTLTGVCYRCGIHQGWDYSSIYREV